MGTDLLRMRLSRFNGFMLACSFFIPVKPVIPTYNGHGAPAGTDVQEVEVLAWDYTWDFCDMLEA